MNSECKIDGCHAKFLAKGFCSFHYYRTLRHIPIDKPFGKKYSLDEDYFGTINTPNKAYLLGVLMADGCVWVRKPKSCYCRLEMKDKELVEFFRDEIRANYPIKKRTEKDTYYMTVCSEKLFDSLSKHGIVPRKTFITGYPETLNGFDSDFIRGYLDGDGFIVHYEGKYPRNRIGWCGNQKLLAGIEDKLKNACGIKHKELYRPIANRSSILQYQSNGDIEKLIGYLYENSNNSFYLKRKRNKAA